MLPHVGATMHEHRISTPADQTIEEAPVGLSCLVRIKLPLKQPACAIRFAMYCIVVCMEPNRTLSGPCPANIQIQHVGTLVPTALALLLVGLELPNTIARALDQHTMIFYQRGALR